MQKWGRASSSADKIRAEPKWTNWGGTSAVNAGRRRPDRIGNGKRLNHERPRPLKGHTEAAMESLGELRPIEDGGRGNRITRAGVTQLADSLRRTVSGTPSAVDEKAVVAVAQARRPQMVSACPRDDGSESGRHKVTRVRSA